MSRPYLAQIENEKRYLTAVKQVAIAKAIGVDPSELVGSSAPNHKGEVDIIQSFSRLNPQQRKEWLDLVRAATGIGPEQDDPS